MRVLRFGGRVHLNQSILNPLKNAFFLLAILTIPTILLPSHVTCLQYDAVNVYLYMFVLETDSDWTSLHFSSGPIIFCLNYSLVEGANAPDLRCHVNVTSILVNKRAFDKTTVRVNVEALALKGGDLNVTIGKGDIGATKLSLYIWDGRKYSLLWTVVNEGVSLEHPGTNDRTFTLAGNILYDKICTIASLNHIFRGLGKTVFAFYYPWYGTMSGPSGQWIHWKDVSPDHIGNSAHYPLLGVYDSFDERLLEAHVLLAKSNGVDGFIVSWWGIGCFEDVCLEKLIRVAEDYGFKIAPYYESYRSQKPLTKDEIVEELSYLVSKYSSSTSFLKVEGRPVIFVYNVEANDRTPAFWQDVWNSLKDRVGEVLLVGDTRNFMFLNVFDGFHTYIDLDRNIMRKLYLQYKTYMNVGLHHMDAGEAIEAAKHGKILELDEKATFYTIIPGYDDRKIRSPGKYLDRRYGETYKAFWNDALDSGAEHILITSWNELHEGTEIEPTREYGFLHLQITRNYSNILKHKIPSEPLNPNTDVKLLQDRENRILVKLINVGEGNALAAKLQIKCTSNITAAEKTYLQPSTNITLTFIIPTIKHGEEYTFTLNAPNKIEIPSAIESINITYYSTTGSEQHIKLLTFHTSTTITTTATHTTTSTVGKTVTLTSSTTTTTVTSYTSTSNEASYWTIIVAITLFALGFMLGWLSRKHTT